MSYITNDIEGWMSNIDLPWLYNQATKMESIVEIGCWKGRSTHALLSGCLGPVFVVDHFKGSPNELDSNHKEAVERDIYEDFKINVGHFPNLVVMRMPSIEAAKFFRPKSVDMVFIDATHTYDAFKADILAWLPICKKLMSGHDNNCGEIVRVLEEIFGTWNRNDHLIWSKDIDA